MIAPHRNLSLYRARHKSLHGKPGLPRHTYTYATLLCLHEISLAGGTSSEEGALLVCKRALLQHNDQQHAASNFTSLPLFHTITLIYPHLFCLDLAKDTRHSNTSNIWQILVAANTPCASNKSLHAAPFERRIMASTTAPNAITAGTTSPYVELSSDASPPIREESRDKENRFFQTLADRVKAKSRRSLPVNLAPVTTEMKSRRLPWLATPLEPQSQKRAANDKAGERPTRRQKVFRDQDTAVRVVPNPRVTTSLTDNNFRPHNDVTGNRTFVDQVIKSLKSRLKTRAVCFGDRQNERICYLLTNASPANEKEMLFLSGAEAADMFKPGTFHNGPILTEGQQPLPLQSAKDFLDEYYDDDTKVSIQDPSVKVASGKHSVREVTIGNVKKRILEGKTKGRPWNCLELATHVEDGLRPTFLAGEDTRLLTKLKIEQGAESARRRSYPQGYKEVEKWALLAESGALTEPHQDSHGYSTYITVNQGRMGFGWLSYPSVADRKTWIKSPESIRGDRFRYVVLQPGQTVFFPAGTVHFVFRLPSAGHTLAFGGHVLRCSNIVHWVKTLLEEKANTYITNEDLTTSAPGYLNRVETFVRQAQKNGTLEKWGGATAVEEFLRLKQEFMTA
jgi:hypothetical protein